MGKIKWLKPRPESGLDWLSCSKFASQRSNVFVSAPPLALGSGSIFDLKLKSQKLISNKFSLSTFDSTSFTRYIEDLSGHYLGLLTGLGVCLHDHGITKSSAHRSHQPRSSSPWTNAPLTRAKHHHSRQRGRAREGPSACACLRACPTTAAPSQPCTPHPEIRCRSPFRRSTPSSTSGSLLSSRRPLLTRRTWTTSGPCPN